MTEWPTSRLADVVMPVRTWNPRQAGTDAEFTYIDLSAVDQESKRVTGDRIVRCADAPSRARQIVAAGDVLVSTVRPNLNGVALVPARLDGATASTGFCVLRPRPDRLHPGYLLHWVRSRSFIADMERQATGASYPAVSDWVVHDSFVPLPPIAEQRRIAEVLDRVEALQAKRRTSLKILGTAARALFADMFGDELHILTRWPTESLGTLLDFLTSGSRGWAAHYAQEGDLFLRIQNVGRDQILLDDVAFVRAPNTMEAARTRVKRGDVLLSITADLGRTAVVPEGLGVAFINQHLSILRTAALEPRFLSAFLSAPAGQRQISVRNRHGVKAGLNFDDVRSIVVPTPPRALQTEFVRRVVAFDDSRRTMLSSQRMLDELFASLQQRAFRGEL